MLGSRMGSVELLVYPSSLLEVDAKSTLKKFLCAHG